MTWADLLAQHGWQMLAIALLLCGSALVNGAEAALFSLSRGQLYHMRHSDHYPQRLVAQLMRTPRRMLNTLLLTNLLLTTAMTALAALVVLDIERAGGSALMTVVMSLLPLVALILLGEMAPKLLGFLAPQKGAIVLAWPVHLLTRVLSPVIWVLQNVLVEPISRVIAPQAAHGEITADELASLLELSARRGIIPQDANALLQEIVELTELKVSDIMVPRVDMVAYDLNQGPAGLKDLFGSSHLRKIPVYDGQIEQILGVIYGKDLLLHPDRPLREMVVKVPFVPETANIERLLVQFRVTRKQFALVVDEFGGLAGLVTLQDIVEEIVGDIPERREEEAAPAVQRVGPDTFVVDGDLAIHEWADAFAIDLAARRISTIGGFVVSLLGRIPREGDEATYRNLRFTVRSVRGRRIAQLQLELTEGRS